MNDELNISKAEPYIEQYDKHADLIREQRYISEAKQQAEQQVNNFNNTLTNNTMKIDWNWIATFVVAIIPSVYEYVNTNGWTWKSLVMGIIAAIVTYFSPSPKNENKL